MLATIAEGSDLQVSLSKAPGDRARRVPTGIDSTGQFQFATDARNTARSLRWRSIAWFASDSVRLRARCRADWRDLASIAWSSGGTLATGPSKGGHRRESTRMFGRLRCAH